MSARSTSKSNRRRRKRLTSGSVAVFAHVPVDRFEIVDGPSREKWFIRAFILVDAMHKDPADPDFPYWQQEFTLLTAASTTRFGRQLKLTAIFNAQSNVDFCFTALFAGRIVFGRYNPTTRKGWFKLD